MSYTSFFFLVFLLGVLVLYFLFPLRYRWIVLLAGSLYFYILAGVKFLPFLLADALISFLAAGFISRLDKQTKKRQRICLLSVTLVALIGLCVLLNSPVIFFRRSR